MYLPKQYTIITYLLVPFALCTIAHNADHPKDLY